MTTDTATLTDWLTQQLDADEAEINRGRSHNGGGTYANDNYGCLLVDPAHVLAQVAAHRAIVEMHREHYVEWVDVEGDDRFAWSCTSGCDPEDGYPCPTLRALAAIYADRDGWREEWR